ncbi:hypothetical protein [Streptomyces sp. NPDC001422]|uniref:hypothetical protein n=1 Tax=Streptomyces sp. NPDC001422 TaxID=3364575 RepID=UPI0036A21AA3
MTIKDAGTWDEPSWVWEVNSGGQIIDSGNTSWRFFAVKAVKRVIRLHAKGKVDTAGSEFTIWY